MQFMHFSAIFAIMAVLATWVTRATHSKGCEWGCCDSICLLGYAIDVSFLQSVALPRVVRNLCRRRKLSGSTNIGLVNGPVHSLLPFFTLNSSKIEVFKTYFFDIVIT